ncbi:MAG: DUF3592 domain-containing protein [Patescibacteria group bacterium]
MQTTFKKVFLADYAVMVSTLTPLIAGVVFIDSVTLRILPGILSRNGNESINPWFFSGLFIISLLIFLPLLAIRIKQIKDILKNGKIINAKVTFINLYNDRGRIEYRYNFDGKEFITGNALHRNKYVESLKVGDAIKIVVSGDNPKKALIKSLFVE